MIIITVVKVKTSFYNYISTPNDLLRSINNGYYSEAVAEMKDNIALGETAEKDPDYVTPYALLDYYEAESFYSGYVRAAEQASAAGDKSLEADLMDRAAGYQADMEAAIGEMGELSFMTEDIDSLFD